MTDPQHDEPRSDVVDMAAAGVFDVDLDAPTSDRRKNIPPMTVRLGGKTWTLFPPDMGTVMDIEDAGTTRAQLALMFDDQWPVVAHLVDAIDDPDKLANLARQYGRHFEIDQQSLVANSAPSRSERRRAKRGRP